MKLTIKNKQANKGFSLLEVIFVVFILAISTIAIYSLFNMALKMVWENKARIGATQLANQKLEIIRNLPYDDIGIITSSPVGVLAENETVILNGINYNIYTNIVYIDDTFDDVVPADSLGNDYKRAQIKISWDSNFSSSPVEFFTDIAPRGIESSEGGGTLHLTVFDISGLPVSDANIHIYNPSVGIDINDTTGLGGTRSRPAMPAANDSYQITVTKEGYSTDQTYNATPELPGPVPGHLSIFEGQVTSKSFSIDQSATMNLDVRDTYGLSLGNLAVHVWGAKTTGTDGEGESVYKYDTNPQTDGFGMIYLTNIEWDTYSLEISTSTGWDIQETDPVAPVLIMPNTSQTVNITASSTAEHSLLVVVTDSGDASIDNASVHVTNLLGLDKTLSTGTAGQAFFTPMLEATTTVEVIKSGYQNYSNEFSLTGYTREPVILIEE